jgi:hypothetical protein
MNFCYNLINLIKNNIQVNLNLDYYVFNNNIYLKIFNFIILCYMKINNIYIFIHNIIFILLHK